MGRWVCDEVTCKRVVEYDGNADGLFSLRRRNKGRLWLLFTRGVVDKLISFIIAGRTTYTAATRHLSSDMHSFKLRRQDVVKLGTMVIRTFNVVPETGRCPACGPNPEFIVIDAQSLGCTDVDGTDPRRPVVDCPVLDIPAPALCMIADAPLRAAINKVLRSAGPLTAAQVATLRAWYEKIDADERFTAESAAAALFFRFFPLGVERAPSRATDGPSQVPDASDARDPDEAVGRAGKRRRTGKTLVDAVRLDADGQRVLGGKGPLPKSAAETWRDRTGICAPAFHRYPRDDDGVWICVLQFLLAFLAEPVAGMFLSYDESAIALLANSFRFKPRSVWRSQLHAVEDVGFVTSFIGRFAVDLDEDVPFRKAFGAVLLKAVEVEKYVDDAFNRISKNKTTIERGWMNATYCKRWSGTPTPADYALWLAEHPELDDVDVDDPLVSFEFFASLPRVRPGIMDSQAAKRRVHYKGKDRHVADAEGEGDACNKAFSIKAGLTQGVFNVVCPHVITLGFRCLFNAESVGEALSIVLERFPKLPRVIFYDVACKIDKNAMRRKRSVMRQHNVRCILDRPHSITHSCSPIYMPDESLGSTAGVATQSAEVSHSVAVVNRTSLAYMRPATYMLHKMAQVAFMNLRKLYRMNGDNTSGENDHVPLAPFYHSKIAHQCERVTVCTCTPAGALKHSVAPSSVPSLHEMRSATTGPAPANDSAAASATPLVQPAEEANLPASVHAEDVTPYEASDTVASDLPEPPASGSQATQAADGRSDAAEVDGDQSAHANRADDPVDESDDENVGQPTLSTLREGLLEDYKRWAAGDPAGGCSPMSTSVLSEAESAVAGLLWDGVDDGEAVRGLNRANIALSFGDFRRLQGSSWLNDEVINSFIALVNRRSRLQHALPLHEKSPSAPRTFVVTTYLYTRLSPRVGLYDYAGVKRWAAGQGLDLTAVDVVVVPVNLRRSHWVMVTIDLGRRTLHYYDPYLTADTTSIIQNVRHWLNDEVRQHLGDDAAKRMAVHAWPEVSVDGLPEQMDGGSCGVFVLGATDCASLGTPWRFTQADIPVLRCRIALSLFFDSLHWDVDGLDTLPALLSALE